MRSQDVRRLEAIERLPSPRPFDPSEARSPATMTSWEVHARILELQTKAINLRLAGELGRPPAPGELATAVAQHRARREARLDALAAQLAHPPGTPPEQITAYLDRKAAARVRRLAELAIPDNEDEDDEAA
jgi:hypothetical protein